MRRLSRLSQLGLVVLLVVFTMGSADTAVRYNDLGHKMMCVCGCGQILIECNHLGCPDSDRELAELRAALSQGKGDTEILEAFQSKYGPTVLAAPMLTKFNLAAWFVPPVVLLLGIVGTIALVRKWKLRTVETPAASPVHDAFRSQWRTILRVIGLNAAGAVAYYMSFVYVTTYLRQIDFISASKALDINTIAVLALMLAIVPMGRLSDRVGRRPVLLAATGGLFVLALPLFWMLHHTDPAILLIGQIGFALLNAAYWGPSTATMVELVPAHIRCTVMSVGYNLGLAILGGATPMVAVYVVHRSGNDLSPAFLVMAAAGVSFLVILGLRESNKAVLAGPATQPATRVANRSD